MSTNSYENWCRYYNGLMNEMCKVGIRYDEVKDATHKGLEQYPCFKSNGCAERCTSASFLSPGEVAEKMRESGEALRKYADNLANDVCPHCGAHIQEKKQVGRCVYSWPCNHRLYQGTLPKTTYSIMDHPYFREQRGEV